MKGVYIFLAEGFEPVEALAPLDVLRRGGILVKTVSIGPEKTVTSAHGIPVVADLGIGEIDLYGEASARDAMIFPGGMPGALNLSRCKVLTHSLKAHFAQGGTVAAICAAPGLVLSTLDGLEGVDFTCYDGFEDYLIAKGANHIPEGCVTDGNIITGRGPGYAVEFGLAILSHLKGEAVAEEVRSGMFLN